VTLPKRAAIFLGSLTGFALLCAACALISRLGEPAGRSQRRFVAENLCLTDLALWYEAMHTRHPSQADMFAPFGDFPGALEHFPSGSLASPPRGIHRSAADQDGPE